MNDWVQKAYELKRIKGISWTKLPCKLFEETGVKLKVSEIRDKIRCYERSNGLTVKKPHISLVVNISDVHIGKKTESYDLLAAKDRMHYLFDEVIMEFKKFRKDYAVDEIHVNFIGDIIDNDFLYPGQQHHTDKQNNAAHGTAQVKEATSLFRDEITRLKTTVKVPIVVNCVRGNHGRTTKFSHEDNNYDVMFYNNLETVLEKVATVNVSHDFYHVAYIQNHGFLLYHGAGIRMYQNIPWYGLVQRCMRWAGSMKYSFDYLIIGHFHTAGDQEWNDKIIFMNGTAVSDDDFPLENLGMCGANKYWLFGVTANEGIMYQRKVNLNEA
jgi:hypothetical protein